MRKAGVFTHAGAWYDGWETRRHNPEPFDWVVVRLGVASGRIRGFEVDTAYFNGNHAPEVSVEGCFHHSKHDGDGDGDGPATKGWRGWEVILGRCECGPSMRQAWDLGKLTDKAYTHVRLCMWPDGGIARFRVFGVAVPVFPKKLSETFDLAAAVNGGVALSCSDQHFGAKDNLLLPGRGVDMGDGWETKRTRGEHVDWVIIKLGTRGVVEKVVIDTAHFRGNFPQKVQVFAALKDGDVGAEDAEWVEILPPQKSGPDKEHEYGEKELTNTKDNVYSHVKLVIIPDGGVKRIRVVGRRVD